MERIRQGIKMNFEILEDWDDQLSVIPDENMDIYFLKKYVTLYENSETRALCVICSDDDKRMFLPFLCREINNYYDFETAYGYGGPISNTEDGSWNQRAFEGIYNFLRDNNYICGLIRFHPLLGNEKYIRNSEEDNINVIYDRRTITINTSDSIDEIWSKQITSKNRNMIRKAEKNGLEYRTEYDFASYDEFIDLYRETMLRLKADDFYFFNREYYYKLKSSLSGHSFLGTVRKNGKLICSAIFIYSKFYGHYHLEGSDRDYSRLGANNLLLWKVACELHSLGVREFHLGGGTGSSPDDSLFKFKKAFSSNEKKFHIAKIVFNSSVYDSITENWEINNQDKISKYGNYLLRYRY